MDKPVIRLTEYSHGSGCGCKIAPSVLDQILHSNQMVVDDPRLLVGNASRDDAAVYDLGDGSSVISTTDFFMPIVDDPFEFGRIAATNAISDIYAMGGSPMMAIAIFGWPLDKLAADIGQGVIEGGRYTCTEAGIALAGGHSIDAPEPIFGLAVTGRVENRYIKRNDRARADSLLYLTKPLGVGILTTATKKKCLLPQHHRVATDSMIQLNRIGSEIARLECVNAMTDVTGFGLAGHLLEICRGSDLMAELVSDAIPTLEAVEFYLNQGCVPGGARRNFESYGDDILAEDESMLQIVCDPQTSGGLLVSVDPAGQTEFESMLSSNGIDLTPIGRLLTSNQEKRLRLI